MDLKKIMNKDSYQIYKSCVKRLKKNKEKMFKICQKYIETSDDNLMPDFEFYASEIYEDSQNIRVLLIAYGIDEYYE